MAKKVLIVGWDGATWDYIEPLLAAGRLPHLATILQDGVHATLLSTNPPYTNVAWPSLVTGLSPAQTGIFDATRALPGSYEAAPTNLGGHRGTAIWHWLNHFGLRCGVLNVPMTFPAGPLDGYMVSGFDSVTQSADVAFPHSLLDTWAAQGRPYWILQEETELMDSQNPHHNRGDLAEFTRRWVELTREQGKLARWLWQQWPVDLFFVVFSGTDSINHRTHDRQQIAEVYEAADAALGDILSVVDDETLLCLLSDHGSTPAYRYISLYRALYDAGWLHFKPMVAARFWQRLPRPANRVGSAIWQRLPRFARRMLSWPLLHLDSRLAVAYENIDWSRTLVYARSGMGALYLNRKGRQPQGIVTGDDYERLRNEVITYLQNLYDAEGRPLFATVQRYEELYSAASQPADDRPDLMFTPARWSDHAITGFPGDPLARSIDAGKPYGTHTPDGILALHGPGIVGGADLDPVQITDVVPTVLAALGLPLPQGIDGRVLQEAFQSTVEISWAAPLEQSDLAPASDAEKPEGSEEIAERLRALGYLE